MTLRGGNAEPPRRSERRGDVASPASPAARPQRGSPGSPRPLLRGIPTLLLVERRGWVESPKSTRHRSGWHEGLKCRRSTEKTRSGHCSAQTKRDFWIPAADDAKLRPHHDSFVGRRCAFQEFPVLFGVWILTHGQSLVLPQMNPKRCHEFPADELFPRRTPVRYTRVFRVTCLRHRLRA